MLKEGLFTIVENWAQLKCPSIGSCLNIYGPCIHQGTLGNSLEMNMDGYSRFNEKSKKQNSVFRMLLIV